MTGYYCRRARAILLLDGRKPMKITSNWTIGIGMLVLVERVTSLFHKDPIKIEIMILANMNMALLLAKESEKRSIKNIVSNLYSFD